jgi:hypothetical protein
VTLCIVESDAIYILVVKFRNTAWPPPPQLSLHRRAALGQAIQTEHGPYIAERTQKAVYIVRCLWLALLKNKYYKYIYLCEKLLYFVSECRCEHHNEPVPS